MTGVIATLDWQFGLVTVAAAFSAFRLVRPLLSRSPGATPGCASCPTARGGCGAATPASPAASSALVTLGGHRRPPA